MNICQRKQNDQKERVKKEIRYQFHIVVVIPIIKHQNTLTCSDSSDMFY